MQDHNYVVSIESASQLRECLNETFGEQVGLPVQGFAYLQVKGKVEYVAVGYGRRVLQHSSGVCGR